MHILLKNIWIRSTEFGSMLSIYLLLLEWICLLASYLYPEDRKIHLVFITVSTYATCEHLSLDVGCCPTTEMDKHEWFYFCVCVFALKMVLRILINADPFLDHFFEKKLNWKKNSCLVFPRYVIQILWTLHTIIKPRYTGKKLNFILLFSSSSSLLFVR